jgi:hypothetical protein
MKRTRVLTLGVLVAIGGASAAAVVHLTSPEPAVSISTSSAVPGSRPDALLATPADEDGVAVTGAPVPGAAAVPVDPTPAGTQPAVPSAAEPENPSREVVWQSDEETVGAWVELTWSEPTPVNHVEIRGAGEVSHAFSAATLTFDGTDPLLVTADESGDANVDLPPRTVSTVRLTITDVPDEATSVALTGFTADASGDAQADHPEPSARPTVTTPAGGDHPDALTDGRVARGDTGAEWLAAPDDSSATVHFAWDSPRELASVQVFGPSQTAFDPSYWAAAPLHGRLVFDDGSSVIISGIAGGDGQATTIAFAPRSTRTVRLELNKTIPAAVMGLREVAFYDRGSTPPRWVQDTPAGHATTPSPATCREAAVPVAEPQPGRLTLTCPSAGSSVDGRATIVVAGDPGTSVQATAWTGIAGDDSMRVVGSATADDNGEATISFETSGLPTGPLTVKVTAAGEAAEPAQDLYVQLINLGGTALPSPGFAPDGMTLQWDEQFTDPVSIAATGTDVTYGAAKPAWWGAAQFGDAVFADPAMGAGNISTVAEDYLRIRVEPIGDRDVRTPWGQEHLGGMLSSLRLGASGFAAQYGYFEARMLGAPGAGTWPAFWMLNSEDAVRDGGDIAGEVDAVELYGHNTVGTCHTMHHWHNGVDSLGASDCIRDEITDWAMSWHTYGVRMVPGGGAIFYIDGVEVSSASGLPHDSEPYFFMIDLALGGGWPVDLSATGDISDLYVDWIRVYT